MAGCYNKAAAFICHAFLIMFMVISAPSISASFKAPRAEVIYEGDFAIDDSKYVEEVIMNKIFEGQLRATYESMNC